MEERGCRVEELLEGKTTMETSSSPPVSTRLQQIAKLAREMPERALTTLAHHIDIELLHEAWKRTRKDGAPGVDGQTAREYEANLRENLYSLLDRAKSGRYRAPAVRRVHIPKGKGKETRAIGIPTLEDKVLQRAVVMVMEAVYEEDFSSCSYGFRPGRSAHDALEALWSGTMDMHGGWLLEVDIRRFFDALDRTRLREILRQRVRDGVLLRLIGKWLKAGVLESGELSYPNAGTPQGGVISPLLANIYLHEVLDKWFERFVRPRMDGKVMLIRYADDFVLLFEHEHDARWVYPRLRRRFEEFGLALHPDKTRLVPFRQPPYRRKERPKESFDFLGFTHHWGRSRKGGWILQRKTARDRLSRSLHAVRAWCRWHRHDPIREQHKRLCAKVRGHFGYFGITGNARSLRAFHREVQRAWHKWLNRRCRKAAMPWETFANLVQNHYPLPPVRVARSIYRGAANP